MDGEISNALDRDAAEIVDSIRQARLEPGAERAVDGAKLDSEGVPFDPRIHTGTLSPKRRWRRRKNASLELLEGGAAAAGAPDAGPAPEQPAADFDQLANLTVVSLTSTLAMLLGAHWRADSEEVASMRDAWAAYYRARGVSDLPPEAMLALAMFGYVSPRLAHPQTRSWLVRAWDAARRGLRRLFRRRAGELQFAPRPGDRSDGHGKDAAAAPHRPAVPQSGNRLAGLVADPPRI